MEVSMFNNKQDYLEMLAARLKREGVADPHTLISNNASFIEKSWHLNVSVGELTKLLRRAK
jgi:hypothetical protein